MSKPIVVVDYDPAWPNVFSQLRDLVFTALGDLALTIEHVGSTAVPGLAAKPVIDLDVVIASDAGVGLAIERLAVLGYVHEGDLGIPGREAFSPPKGSLPHHLYVCRRGNPEYRRHVVFRNYLRSHPETAQSYAALKKAAASEFRDDRAAYTRAKSAFIKGVLECADHSVD